ncbi:MAG: signal peptidase I [Verrucomicrobiales bacterium]|nr:signal peptidase I [Verrucomicrobiales bacterium]
MIRYPRSMGGLLGAVGIAAILAWVQVQLAWNIVVGDSMLPNLRTGDVVIVSKRAYLGRDPQRGEIVVVRYRGETIVKRIIGLPGEEVEVRNGQAVINGTAIVEAGLRLGGPLTLGRGRLFDDTYAVVSDNRSLPAAQSINVVTPRNQILGRVLFSVPTSKWMGWAFAGRPAS